MAGLLYKEFILNRRNILIGFSGILFLSIFVFMPAPDELKGSVYTFLMLLICLILVFMTGNIQESIFGTDEKKVWANFIASTPLSVKGQVLSKYCFTLLISIALIAYCTIIFGINTLIQGESCGVMKFVLGFSVVQLFMRSIEFPFLIRFSSRYGNSIRMVFGFLIVFIALIYGLFGDLSIFGTFYDFMDWFIKLTSGEYINNVWRVVKITAPILTAVLYYLSYRLSCRFYPKGVENYDK